MNYKHNKKLTENAKELRKNMTKEEKHLWYDYLSKYPIRILKQKVIDNYIVDFYCAQAGLIIELDGSQHGKEEAVKYDQIRTEKLGERGLIVIRIPNSQINENFWGVCNYIDNLIKDLINKKSPNKAPLLKGAVTEESKGSGGDWGIQKTTKSDQTST